MGEVLTVRGLNKSFGGIVVARNVDLTLQSGRVVGLIGPNGAGKTSLFNLVCGVVKPDAGTVLLNGDRLDGMTFHKRVRRGLSRTWQHVRLFPSLPVIDNLLIATHQYPGERLVNILFGRGRLKAHDKTAREKATDVLAAMGLANRADALVS
ncbi:MAG: ABC transporter ATP-binding protein, partial [Hyphomicrobiales bacterium]|nr:ABC transporter ATP-binding protein [Hyphomicrobiales bacterium]